MCGSRKKQSIDRVEQFLGGFFISIKSGKKEYSIKLEYANVLCTLIGIRRGFSLKITEQLERGDGVFWKLFSIKYLWYIRPSSGIAMIITTTITARNILMIYKTRDMGGEWGLV